MPRIRKKTSRRGTTNQREKIKHKAAETRKKRKKDAKKNAQWKSKHKKDPGIPNNFPYKDEILAEVAEQRRQAEEAKLRQKELRKASKEGAAGDAESGSEAGSDVGYDGVSAVHEASLASGSRKGKAVEQKEDADAEEAPVLINPDFPNLEAVLSAADVVVEVLDARDPVACRLQHVEEVVKEKKGQRLLFVLNKIDACPRESAFSWASHLRVEHPTLLFRSASAFIPSETAPSLAPAKGKDKVRADDALGLDSVLAILEKWAEEKGDETLTVAVVGLTNVGKSSLVNSLARKASVLIYKLGAAQEGPSTTTHAQEVAIEVNGKRIRLIDTPGITWVPPSGLSENEAIELRARDILIRNKGRVDRLKDPEPVVHEIVKRANQEDLMLFYNLPAFAEKDSHAFLSAFARANSLIKKGGVLDITGASRLALRDWSTGKFPRYTVPGPASTCDAKSAETDVYAKDEAILATLRTRKELRKSSGLVKLETGVVDTRKVDLETSWMGNGEDEEESGDEDDDEEEVDVSAEDEEEEDESEQDMDGEDEEEGGEDDDDDVESGDEEELVQPHGKRKRSDSTNMKRPAKKVAFAAEPKNTKKARSLAGAKGAAIAASRKAIRAQNKPASDSATQASKSKQAKPSTKKTVPAKKAANSVPGKKAAEIKPGEEAYDFKKFF